MINTCTIVGDVLDTAILDLTTRNAKEAEQKMQGLLLTYKYEDLLFFKH